MNSRLKPRVPKEKQCCGHKYSKCLVLVIEMWRLLFSLAFIPGGEISSKTELDELQEEVARRAQEQELQRKREKELEAAKGFNPHPSRFMDLDELQNQGNCCEH